MLNLVYFYLNIYIKKYSYLRIFFYPLYIHLHVSRSNNQTEKLTSFVIRFWSLYFFSFISLYFFPYHVKFVDVMKRIVIKKKKRQKAWSSHWYAFPRCLLVNFLFFLPLFRNFLCKRDTSSTIIFFSFFLSDVMLSRKYQTCKMVTYRRWVRSVSRGFCARRFLHICNFVSCKFLTETDISFELKFVFDRWGISQVFVARV